MQWRVTVIVSLMVMAVGEDRSRWSTKQSLVAVLLGTLVAIAVATAASIGIAPAHISFHIANATTSVVAVEGNPHLSNGYYNLTLVANNTSHRTSVRYASLSARIWYSATGWIPAEDIDTAAAVPHKWQRPRETAAVAVWAEYGQYDETKNSPANNETTSEQLDEEKGSADCTVVLQAKVWFRPGVRPYTITVTCYHVNFVNNATTGFPVQCRG